MTDDLAKDSGNERRIKEAKREAEYRAAKWQRNHQVDAVASRPCGGIPRSPTSGLPASVLTATTSMVQAQPSQPWRRQAMTASDRPIGAVPLLWGNGPLVPLLP